jgi:predicted ATPase
MITEIKLSNFRGFDNHTIPLRPVTIIVGKNNAGKSTVVEALRLISAITRRFQGLNYHELPSWLDRPRRERCVFPSTNEFEFNSEAVFHRHGDPPARITAKFSTGEQVEAFIGSESKLVGVIKDAKGQVIRSKGQANRLQLPQVGILPQIGPLLREETIRDEGYVRRSVDSSRSSLHFRNQLHFLRQHFTAFKQLAENTWHGVSVKPIEMKQLTPTERGLSLFIRDCDFEAEVGSMGHGLQMWLQTMWFLTHCGQSSSIILDEPDVYMHADLQRRLIRLLRTRHHQTIIATHSVEIMSEVEPDEILVIDRRKRTSTFAGSQPEVQSLLTSIGSIHNIQLARLNAAGRFIMVEGDDMDFLKRFQNTLFPTSVTPIDTIPHKSVGGWNGWERARGLALLLQDAAPTAIRPYCILDSDYYTPGSIQKRLKTAKAEGIQLHIWKRKEIENYLLVPAAIRRAIEKSNPKNGVAPTNAEVEEKLEEIADGLRMDVLNLMAAEFFEEDRKGGFPGANKQAMERLEKTWKSLDGKLTVISGKEAIHRLAKWASKQFGVSLNAVKLAKELTHSEIVEEIQALLTAIEEGEPFA